MDEGEEVDEGNEGEEGDEGNEGEEVDEGDEVDEREEVDEGDENDEGEEGEEGEEGICNDEDECKLSNVSGDDGTTNGDENETEPDVSKIRTISFGTPAVKLSTKATKATKAASFQLSPETLKSLQGKSERELMKLKVSEITEYLEELGKAYAPPKQESVKLLIQLAGL
jgi:hypothetical protein